MIDLKKKYRTQDRYPVRNLTKTPEGNFLGEYLPSTNGGKWCGALWFNNGRVSTGAPHLDLIEVDPKTELLEEAKRRYPVGTKFKSACGQSDKIYEVKEADYIAKDNGNVENGLPWLRFNGKWAEIVNKVTVYFSRYPDGGIDCSTIAEGEYVVAKKEIEFTEGEGL